MYPMRCFVAPMTDLWYKWTQSTTLKCNLRSVSLKHDGTYGKDWTPNRHCVNDKRILRSNIKMIIFAVPGLTEVTTDTIDRY